MMTQQYRRRRVTLMTLTIWIATVALALSAISPTLAASGRVHTIDLPISVADRLPDC